MTDAEMSIQQCFARNVMKIIFVLLPGYTSLPEPLQFVYTMLALFAEVRFEMVVPAPNRTFDPTTSNQISLTFDRTFQMDVIKGFKEPSTTRMVLNEFLGLEVSNFARLLKLRPRMDEDHELMQQLANKL